jgi:hypothetical protein
MVSMCLEGSPVRLLVKNTFLKIELEDSEDGVHRKRSRSDGSILDTCGYGHDAVFEQATHDDKDTDRNDKGHDGDISHDYGILAELESTSTDFSIWLDCTASSDDGDDEIDRNARINYSGLPMELPILSHAKSFAQTPSWDMLAPKMSHFSTPYSTSAPVSSLAYAPKQIAAYVETKMDVEIAEAERKVRALRAQVSAQRANVQGCNNFSMEAFTHGHKSSEIHFGVEKGLRSNATPDSVINRNLGACSTDAVIAH